MSTYLSILGMSALATAMLASCTTGQGPELKIQVSDRLTIMTSHDFGIKTNLRTWDSTATIVSVTADNAITENYDMLVGKRSHCHNTGISRTYTLVNPQNDTLLIEYRKMQDGQAFRYILTQVKEGEALLQDLSTFHIPAEVNRWMQKYNGPGYEHFFPLCPGGVSPEGEKYTRWGIPALIESPCNDQTGNTSAEKSYMLITESDLMRGNAGSILANTDENRNDYTIQLLDSAVTLWNGWKSPWRVVITGSLSDIVESTLVNDLATPNQFEDTSWIETGLSSWIYWAYNHGSQEYKILKEYVDLAVDMKWPYTLVDAEWDVMRGGNIEQLVKYSLSKGIKPMIWYNSTTGWYGEGVPTPQNRLNDPENRAQEFKTIADWGVKGVKIDFFGDDNVGITNYYIDLLESAYKEKMLVNFHGGTLNRGWQRTYPNMISTEAVYGAEWYNNRDILTDKAACHNATLPFTRNVIGSMDYTPGTFTDSQHPHITTHAHELALTILFESGIQHMPDRPSAYRSLPTQVRDLLSNLPSAWDDTKLLAGYPGKSVVLTRRKGDNWYIAGINGLDEPQDITFSTSRLDGVDTNKECLLVADGETQLSFSINSAFTPGSDVTINCSPRGGFVIKL